MKKVNDCHPSDLIDINKSLNEQEEDGYATDDTLSESMSLPSHDETQASFCDTKVKQRPIPPRFLVLDKWGNTSVDRRFECGAFVVENKLEQVTCRIFVESHVATFQSTCENDDDNRIEFKDVKVYVNKFPFPSDYIILGLMFTPSKFTFVINGFLVKFKQLENDGLCLTRHGIDPRRLPRDLKLKVVPLTMALSYVVHIRGMLTDYNHAEFHFFSKSHILANILIGYLTTGLCKLAVEFAPSKVGGMPSYKSMKITRNSEGKTELVKK